MLSYNMDIVDEIGTYYVDNFECDFNGCDLGVYLLNKVYHQEGYAELLSSTNKYCYYRKDHLGNNREVWQAAYSVINRGRLTRFSSQTIQQMQYYPSGLPWAQGMGQSVQTRKYNGKEFDEMNGYDSYDYIFRNMHSAKMRFDTPDALMELHYDISPYAYCMNNPIRYIDPLGLDTVNVNTNTPVRKGDVMVDDDGNVVGTSSTGEAEVKPKTTDYIYYYLDIAMKSIGSASTAANLKTATRYMERPWGGGYFVTLKGIKYPLSVLKPQSNGKLIRGIAGLKTGAKNAQASVRLLTKTANVVGYVTLGYDAYKFKEAQTMENGAALVIDVASYAFWEVGVASAYSQTMYDYQTETVRPEMENNLQNNVNPTNGIFVPGAHWGNAASLYSPF